MDNGRAALGAIPLADLSRRFGTPLYVYDAATIRRSLAAYRDAFAAFAPTHLAYSAKACALLGVLALFRSLRVSAASLGELEAAVRAGVPAERCWLHGNAKTDEEIASAIGLGVGTIVIDGEREHERISRAVPPRRRQDVWLRVASSVVAETHAHLRTGGEQKFGAPLADGRARELAHRIASTRGLRLVGVHAHAGSQIGDLDTFARVATELARFARGLRDDGLLIRVVCVGGGLAVPQTRLDPTPDLHAYARAVAGPVREHLPESVVAVELGRSLVARAGIALYRVVERRQLPSGKVFVAVDGGMGDNIRPALYAARYEAALADRAAAAAEERVTVAGAYCEAGDLLIEDAPLPRASPGDVLAVPAVGAYSIAMASNYNHRPRPAVVLVDRGRIWLIRRRERTSDLLRLERVPATGARARRGARGSSARSA